MGCLYQFGVKAILLIGFFLLLASFLVAMIIDFNLAAAGERPYFFDPEKIESYDKPMLDGFEKKMEENYLENLFHFQNLENHIPYLPERIKYTIKFVSENEVDLSGNYATGWKLRSNVDYTDDENKSFLNDLGWTRFSIEDLKNKLSQINCTSFEKDDGYRAGFADKQSGTYYYRFSSYDSSEQQNAILDSCLIKYYKNDIFFEYKGYGRGPDCIKSKNDADFDNRNYIEKWRDFLKEGKISRSPQ